MKPCDAVQNLGGPDASPASCLLAPTFGVGIMQGAAADEDVIISS